MIVSGAGRAPWWSWSGRCWSLSQPTGPSTYEDITEHFKYGSIGSEPGGSLLAPVGGVLPPYWVFKALPSICSDRLPGGIRVAFGFISEPGTDLPIGVSRRRRLGHRSGRVQLRASATPAPSATRRRATPRIVLGMPAQQLDLQSLVQFVLDCTLDNRMTAERVSGRLPKQAAGRRCSSGCCCASGWSTG